jgi:N6-L-threonylcarbamoyladenine synthase
MIILGIETSCDETAAAVIENGTKVLSNAVASSVELHQKTGGIIPEVAAREQLKCMVPVIKEAIQQSNNITINNINALAVTIGPGLIGSLLVGVETAKALAYAWEKPIIPINHLQAHLYANWLMPEQESKRAGKQEVPEFPTIGLVVSGGHTDLVLMKNHGEIKWLGGTRDDAAGECFDKAARVLNLGYPGGPAIAATAAKQLAIKQCNNTAIKLPRPMINDDNYDFSFSGLKTAVINEVKKLKNNQQFNNLTIQQLSFEIQEAITDVLVAKTIRAAEKYQVKSILLAGGVAANSRLREKFNSQLSILNFPFQFWCPPPKLCTDNAVSIACCAYFNQKFVSWEKVKVEPGLRIC